MATGSIVTDLQAAARFGGEGMGVTRFAWSPELFAVIDWLGDRVRELGLEAEIDAAGNFVGKWRSGSGPAVMVASHLDTVPRGGRFDGALGVLSGLQALRILRAEGVEPRRPIWLGAFMDEEGARFKTSMLGSKAFVGDDVSEYGERRDADGVSVREAMKAAGFDFDRITDARAIDEVGSYLELHIEQGPVLEQAGVDIGIVTAIVGLIGYRARFTGEANHAGTTPMALRRDALVGAARAVVALRDEARGRDDAVANVGIISVEPGGFNVVPGACEFTIDIRSQTAEGMARNEEFVNATLERIAAEERLELSLREIHRFQPVPLDPELIAALERAAELEGASFVLMPSGAGHDAQIVGRHVPAAMLFVPSRRGISHSPEELTEDRYCELGARVLARALTLLAG